MDVSCILSLKLLELTYFLRLVGFDPATIGTCLGIYGIMGGVLQGLFFPLIVRKLGTKRVFFYGMFAFLPIFSMFPVLSVIARAQGYSTGLWIGVAFQMLCAIIIDTCYGE